MHDVLDNRDLVPDEAEQLLHSGYEVTGLLEQARAAAVASDYSKLESLSARLVAAPCASTWKYDENDDAASLLHLADALPILEVDQGALADRIYGAWLGRCVGNTMGKPI